MIKIKLLILAAILILPSCSNLKAKLWPIELALFGTVTPQYECYEAGCIKY